MQLDWREVDGCLLLRDRSWYADDVLRPSQEARSWLRDLQRKGSPYVLTLADVSRLLSLADDEQLGALGWSALLPGAIEIASHRSLFRLWSALDAGRARKLFSPEGLQLSQLTPAQRELAVGHTLGRPPIMSAPILQELGGDLTIRLRMEEGRLKRELITPRRLSPVVIDLRLPDPKQAPEVCRVAVEPVAKEESAAR